MGNEQVIEGVIVQELKQISDQRGSVMHMIRADHPLFEQFGEVYFSEIFPGVVKGWKRHKLMTQLFAVPVGMIKLVIYDERKDSPTSGKIKELKVGRDNYQLIKIPPKLWYGFQCISESPALLVNCADLPHDPNESENVEPPLSSIPYQW